MNSYVILSTTLILTTGNFHVTRLTQEEAIAWVKDHNPTNYCGHQTVKAVGLQPATSREVCNYYKSALCLKPLGRLEFGKEYSLEEILAVGVDYLLITEL